MGTLNPDLLSKDLDAAMNDAVALKDQYKKPVLMPELLLLALLRGKDTAAARLLDVFKNSRGADLDRLTRQTELAVESRRDQDGNLDFVAAGNRMRAALAPDDHPDRRRAQPRQRPERSARRYRSRAGGPGGKHASAPAACCASTGSRRRRSTTCARTRQQVIRADGTTQDFVAGAKSGKLKAVYFREDLLRDLINILTQSVNRHVILVGPDGVGKRTLAYSLALLMSEGKGPKQLKSLVQVDEAALLDNDQKAIRAGLSQARGGVLFIPHIHRFFGGPIKAEFSKSTSLIQKAFLDDDPVIIGTTTEHGIQPAARRHERHRREQPDSARAGAVGRRDDRNPQSERPHLESDYGADGLAKMR